MRRRPWVQVERGFFQLPAAGLDLGEVQNVVDQVEQVQARSMDHLGVFVIALGASAKILVEISSEKPIMALSGVRSSWPVLARNCDLARLAASALSRPRSESSLAQTSSASSALRSSVSHLTRCGRGHDFRRAVTTT